MYGLMNLRLLPGNWGKEVSASSKSYRGELKWIRFTFDKNTRTAQESSDDSTGLIIQLFISRIKALLYN